MNQINIRTEKGDYVGGETIYGAVYLRISGSTGAHIILLKFKGYESSEFFRTRRSNFTAYTGEDQEVTDVATGYERPLNVLKGKKVYFNSTLKLWEEKETLPQGHYVFPFQYQLPPDLPGTFYHEAQGEKFWKGNVKYKLKATIIGDNEYIKFSQAVVIKPYNNKLNEITPKPMKQIGIVKKCFCYTSGEVHVTVRTNKAIYKAGELAHVHITIKNESSEDINAVRVNLRRTVRLLGWWQAGNHGDENDVAEYHGKPADSVFPDKSVVVWANLLQGHPKSEASNVCERDVDIPLVENLTTQNMVVPLLPSTLGSLVRCAYHLSVDVDVPYAPDITVVVPIVAIQATSNEEWADWTPPDWITHCQIKQSSDECSVRQSIVDSHIFSKIPPFQPT
ncbi:arrestin domain-containing protein A-like [Glandiceps talaboti]